MCGYGATLHREGSNEYFILDGKGIHPSMDSGEVPNCVIDWDIATFKFYTEKPELPYAVGSCLKAHPHTPQPPDNDNFPGFNYDYSHKNEKRTKRPFERCLLHPPLPGNTEAGIVEFKVVDWVQAGDPNNSQVVAIRIINSTVDLPTDVNILAKIYDPLYFNHFNDYLDIFQFTDYCYRRESAAYKHLVDLQGSVIPKYYGSYTISLPGNGKISRDVRLILTEVVPGPSMSELDPSGIEQAEQSLILNVPSMPTR